jgi:glutaredoxin/glutathione-dependent peroxiredoxin
MTRPMPIQPGAALPDATLFESTEFGEACPVSPSSVQVAEAAAGKRIGLFGLPGAFTPTCSARHVPGYLEAYEELRKKGVDEIWCVSVNDGFVMAEWGRAQNALGKIRFLGDGSAEFTRRLGLEVDLPGMGTRMRRFSMLVENGVVRAVNLEEPRKFEVSDAATMLRQLGG